MIIVTEDNIDSCHATVSDSDLGTFSSSMQSSLLIDATTLSSVASSVPSAAVMPSSMPILMPSDATIPSPLPSLVPSDTLCPVVFPCPRSRRSLSSVISVTAIQSSVPSDDFCNSASTTDTTSDVSSQVIFQVDQVNAIVLARRLKSVN